MNDIGRCSKSDRKTLMATSARQIILSLNLDAVSDFEASRQWRTTRFFVRKNTLIRPNLDHNILFLVFKI